MSRVLASLLLNGCTVSFLTLALSGCRAPLGSHTANANRATPSATPAPESQPTVPPTTPSAAAAAPSQSSASPPDHQPIAREPRLELTLEQGEPDPVVALRLVNGGPTPITVDRLLVLCVSIDLRRPDGSAIKLDSLDSTGIPGRSSEDRRQWFVQLAPGESLDRRIRLRDGFAHFQTATPLYSGPNGEVRHGPTQGYETLARLPAALRLSDIAQVTATYEPYAGFAQDGFRTYTGLTPKEIGLFDGKLSVTLKLH